MSLHSDEGTSLLTVNQIDVRPAIRAENKWILKGSPLIRTSDLNSAIFQSPSRFIPSTLLLANFHTTFPSPNSSKQFTTTKSFLGVALPFSLTLSAINSGTPTGYTIELDLQKTSIATWS